MAWIKPYRYWNIMSSPSHYAYQLEKNGPVYKIYDATIEWGNLVSGPGIRKSEETTVEEMAKLEAYYDYGVFDPKKGNLRYVDAAVPLAWCIARKRGLGILREVYDQRIAAMYDCKSTTKKKKKSTVSRFR